MRTVLLALALLSVAPLACAQILVQPPPFAGVRPVGPPGYPDDYWRQRRGEEEWRRRAEFREEEHRREEWRRAHCVQDYRGEEYCRR